MAQKTYNILNYGKEYKQAFLELLSDNVTRFTLPDEIDGVQYSLAKGRWDSFKNLQYIDFNKCNVIPERTCADCTNLVSIIFPIYTMQINDYAFDGCTKLDITELPHTLTNIGERAFGKAGSSYSRGTHTFTMTNNDGVHTSIGDEAFYESHLGEITAYLDDVGRGAFYNCSSLTKVDVEIHGSMGNSVFSGCYYVMDFRINPNSVITSMWYGMFSWLGYYTSSDPNFHIADFDFRNSTFPSLFSDMWELCHFDGKVFFPSTLKYIYGNFLSRTEGNWMLYFNSVPSVSSSAYLRDDSSDTFTVKYAFPYTQLDTVLVTTNWSLHTSQMVGYGTGFEEGTVLPAYRRDTGVSITWYSDVALTTPITTSSSATDIYYCSLGLTRLVWFVDTPFLANASFTISDGVNTYSAGDPIPVDASLTITPIYTDPTKNQLFLLSVNGTDYTSMGSASITMTRDLYIEVVYWDGIDLPIVPTLSDNTWEKIKLASQTNSIPSTWHIGDTKTFTYNGDTYTARLVDMTGKFKRASDDSTAYLSFEVIELLPDAEMYNSNSNNNPNESELLAKMNSGTIWDNMDADLKSALEMVKVKVSQGGGSSTEDTIIDWEGKLFLAREHDLVSVRGISVQAEWDLITQDQYYQANNTSDARKKYKKNDSVASSYFTMSPDSHYSDRVSSIAGRNGDIGFNYSTDLRWVAMRFAL